MKVKRALKALQISANDKTILVGSPKMTPPTEKVLEDSKEVLKTPKVVGKENLKSSIRTKRKVIDNKPSKAAKEITVKKIVKSSKSKPQKFKKAFEVDDKIVLNQPTIESFLSSNNIGFNSVEENYETENVGNIIDKHTNEEVALIESETSSQTYWQNLAEQKRIALQEALLENKSLTDQVNALETENSLIKSALEVAEDFLKREGL